MMYAAFETAGFSKLDAADASDDLARVTCLREERLRVLHLGRVGYIGGAERILLSLACAGAMKGIEAFLACPPGPLADEARRHGLPVALVPFSRMKITSNPLKYVVYGANRATSARRLVEICREYGIDILHAHHPVTALYCERAVKELGVPLVLHLHEGPPGRVLYKLALRRAAKLASKIICVSNAGMQLLKAAGTPLRNATVVHNGVTLPRIHSSKKIIGGKPNELSIAVIGVIEPRKGQDLFVEAVAMITPCVPQLRCYVIGDTPANGAEKYKEALKERVKELKLEREVVFVPYTPNMIEQMRAYDIVVSSSTGLESLGFVVLEAMTQGRVVVATKVGGIDDVIEHGVNGFLAEPGCALSLAQGIREAISCDRAAVGAAAELIRDQFSVESMCAEVGRVYQILERARAQR